jgi:glycine hydroxymethyltransferase
LPRKASSNSEAVSKVTALAKAQHEWRTKCLPLMCSENAMSPTARELLASDFHGRYANSHGDGVFIGNRYIEAVDEIATDLAKRLFGAGYVELHSPSAAMACHMPLLASMKKNDLVVSLVPKDGGYPTLQTMQWLRDLVPTLRVGGLPFDAEEINIDADAAVKQVRKEKPRVMVLGATFFLFPHPVKELASAAKEVGALVVYDAAQVFGLVAGKQFQRPFEEGADVVTGSTHKTIPGPQGGVTLMKRDDELARRVTEIQHGETGAGHPNLRAVQAVVFAELLEFGEAYAKQIIKNSQALAQSLAKRGFRVVGEKNGYTKSHMLVIDVSKMGNAYDVAKILDLANITGTPSGIPGKDKVLYGGKISGIRFGPEESVRLGMGVSEMDEAAEFVARALLKREDPKKIARDIAEFRKDYQKMHFSFDDGAPAYAYPSAR